MTAVIKYLKNKEVINIKLNNVEKIQASVLDNQEGIEIYSFSRGVEFYPLNQILSIIIF